MFVDMWSKLKAHNPHHLDQEVYALGGYRELDKYTLILSETRHSSSGVTHLQRRARVAQSPSLERSRNQQGVPCSYASSSILDPVEWLLVSA